MLTAAAPHQLQCVPHRWSDTICKNGDCSSCTARPCVNVWSKTGSPVPLLKSAITNVSVSVIPGERCRDTYPATAPAMTIAAATAIQPNRFFLGSSWTSTSTVARPAETTVSSAGDRHSFLSQPVSLSRYREDVLV